jgi:hypothetical protein
MAEGFGNRKEWERFKKEYPVFLKHYDALEATANKFFERESKADTKADWVIFGLGFICAEDFQQAFVLCGNGFGIGALQIVRGMYERQVTAAYLSKYPQEVQDFLDYHHVHRRKGLIHLKEMYGTERAKNIIPPKEQEEIEASFQSVKDRFTQTLCETCQTTRPMLSWTKHHPGVLAQKGDHQVLAQNYYVNYYRPTLLSHSTVSSLVSRLVQDDDGTLAFAVDGQRNRVREALINAHTLLIEVFDLQNKHFKLGLDDEISKRFDEYKECYGPSETSRLT